MKTQIFEVRLDFVNALIALAVENEVEFNEYEGVLNDDYIFYDTERLSETFSEEGLPVCKYIIIKNIFKTPWTSDIQLIATNDIDLVTKYEGLLS